MFAIDLHDSWPTPLFDGRVLGDACRARREDLGWLRAPCLLALALALGSQGHGIAHSRSSCLQGLGLWSEVLQLVVGVARTLPTLATLASMILPPHATAFACSCRS